LISSLLNIFVFGSYITSKGATGNPILLYFSALLSPLKVRYSASLSGSSSYLSRSRGGKERSGYFLSSLSIYIFESLSMALLINTIIINTI
jgi:hypothetical protein